jgi:hypothetical protein
MMQEGARNEISPEFVETLPEELRPLLSGSAKWLWKRRY